LCLPNRATARVRPYILRRYLLCLKRATRLSLTIQVSGEILHSLDVLIRDQVGSPDEFGQDIHVGRFFYDVSYSQDVLQVFTNTQGAVVGH
jgi:hypothetical protein